MGEDEGKTKEEKKPWYKNIGEFHQKIEQRIEEQVKSAQKYVQEHSKLQCPKCDSRNIKTLKPGFWKQQTEASLQFWTMGIRKPTQPLNVCRDCGFSWEDR